MSTGPVLFAKEKLGYRSQHSLNRLLSEIGPGVEPIFRIFHEVSGHQSGVGICTGKDPHHTGSAADFFRHFVGLFSDRGQPDGLEILGKGILIFVRNMYQNIAHEMYFAPLPTCPWEAFANSCNKTSVCISNSQSRSTEPSLLQPTKKLIQRLHLIFHVVLSILCHFGYPHCFPISIIFSCALGVN